MKLSKVFIRKCVMFIGASLFLISLPFWLIEIDWCTYVGYILSMGGFTLICISIVHQFIFGGEFI